MYVLFFGTKKKFNDIAHHTIWLTERFETLLEDIFEKKKLTKDFSLYIHRPTATDDTFAPSGCDSFYVLCPVPNLKNNLNWDVEGENLKRILLMNLKKLLCLIEQIHY